MAVIIGSARHDEHGNCYSGGKAGDQTGQEVSTQKFYNHSKGWNVFVLFLSAPVFSMQPVRIWGMSIHPILVR